MNAILFREKVKIEAAPAILYALSQVVKTNLDVLIEWMHKAGIGTVKPLLEEMIYCIDALIEESEKEINNFTPPQRFEVYGFTEKTITIKVNPMSLFMIIQVVNLNRKVLLDKIVIQDESLDFSEHINKCLDSIIDSASKHAARSLREYGSQLN